MQKERPLKPIKKPATLRNCLMSAAVTACGFLGLFSYAMFTGHLQRGIPYDIAASAQQHAQAQIQANDERDMAAAFQYGK